jgi:LacI family transcriptional regulator
MGATRADVAALAGVSPALVSFVVNGGPRPVSTDARRRIEAAIEALDYRPNAIAQALRSGGPTRRIGLLIPSAVNQFFGELSAALEEALFEADHTLTVGIGNDDPAREAFYAEAFARQRIDGVIIISSRPSPVVAKLLSARCPSVVIDRVADDAGASAVGIDNDHAVATPMAHLRGHGHTAIGCVGGRVGTALADQRVEAWRDDHTRHSGFVPERALARADFTEEGGYLAGTALLGNADGLPLGGGGRMARPTAVFASSDIQAVGLLRACVDLHLDVPGDVAVASVDGTSAAGFTVPRLTTYVQPIRDIARAAVGAVLGAIAGPSADPVRVVLRGELRVGESCGCHPSRPLEIAHRA